MNIDSKSKGASDNIINLQTHTKKANLILYPKNLDILDNLMFS
jgi:hypothetical protein